MYRFFRIQNVLLLIIIIIVAHFLFDSDSFTEVAGWSINAEDYVLLSVRVNELENGKPKSASIETTDHAKIQSFLDYISQYKVTRCFKKTFTLDPSEKTYHIYLQHKGDENKHKIMNFIGEDYVEIQFKTYTISNKEQLDTTFLLDFYSSLK